MHWQRWQPSRPPAEADMIPPIIVVKVGGSLFDLPDLGLRLSGWLQSLATPRIILLPGGGPTADVIRDLDRRHHLGEEKSHWLALRALTLNAFFLADLVQDAAVVRQLEECPVLWEAGRIPIFDAHAFARADEDRAGKLPHSWNVSSDALAARLAVVAHASRLVLLKSTSLSDGPGWREAGERGFVDRIFADVLEDAARELEVVAVNLRA
jgi:aspartokinase-like uncharacterized kinase